MRIRPGGASPLFLLLALAAPLSAQRGGSIDPSRPITYFIATGSRASGFREGDRTLARWAIETWAREAGPLAKPAVVREGSEADATVRIYWISAEDGLFGEMRQRQVDGRFAADVFIHPETDDLGADIARQARLDPLFRDAIVFLTCVHELGHAFGLPHTSDFADIMYSFQFGGDFVEYFQRFRRKLGDRDDIRTTSPFSAGDVRAFGALHH